MKFDWKATVKTVAPALATALGGPLAGLATKALSETLLGKPDASEAEIAAAVQGATPDQLLALKQADNQFKVDMKKLDIDLARIDTESQASARSMATSTSLWPQIILSIVYIGGYFVVLILFMYGQIDVGRDYIGTFKGLLGLLSAPNLQILNFWFGTSRSSSEKNALLANR